MKPTPASGKMRLLPLAMTVFFCVSGGPYGLEPLMQSGAGLGLLLIVLTPIVLALPVALLTSELSSALPEEGGYYVWVKYALGRAAGFFCAWLTYLYSWVDVAIYPVLFVSYLKNFAFCAALQNPVNAYLTALAFIILLSWLNIRGIKAIGLLATVFGIAMMLPFVAMVIAGLAKGDVISSLNNLDLVPNGHSVKSSIPEGLFVIMWNYLGWDSISTVSGEIERPRKSIPIALLICVPVVILTYLLPALIGLHAQPNLSQWQDGSWPAIAAHVGGPWLSNAIAIGGLLSAAGLFMAALLTSSRIPFVLAEDKILPGFLTKQHPRYGTPWVAIIVSSMIFGALCLFNFKQLAEIDVILYSTALQLEFAALLVLRIREPQLPRPFKIPGGWTGLLLVVICPLAMIGFAFYSLVTEDGYITLILLGGGILSGIVLWLTKSNPQNNTSSESV